MPNAFCFILTVLDYDGPLRQDLVPGYHFARADDEQLEFIHKWLAGSSFASS